MSLRYVCILLWFSPVVCHAQLTDARIAPTKTAIEDIELFLMPPLDNEALLSEELNRRRPGVPPRFATTIPVNIRPATHGNWEVLPGGEEAVWRLRIRSKGAHSLNLGFTEFHLPRGGSMILYSPDKKRVMGPFTPADNENHGQLWTPVFDGDALVLEVRVPVKNYRELQLSLQSVNHDFLGFTKMLAGDCNLDVACGTENGWKIVDLYRDVIQSVAVYGFDGNTFCTGFLVNNSRQDCTPYFMTAYHCNVNEDNAPSMVVYWNYQNSICRPPSSPENGYEGDGKLEDFNSGAIFRAGFAATDFTLLELDDPVSDNAQAFFAGWSREETPPEDTLVCIHHPNSQEKRISFSFEDAYPGEWGTSDDWTPNGNHLVVPSWTVGTTEVGSSGAPLFDRHQRVVGQLHGGLAACGNQLFDQFGWFQKSWTGGGTPSTSLRDWLDPDGEDPLTLDGKEQKECTFFLKPTVAEQQLCSPGVIDFEFSVSSAFNGPVFLSVGGLPEEAEAVFSNNPAAPGSLITLTIETPDSTAPGEYKINAAATDSTTAVTSGVVLHLFDNPPQRPLPEMPLDGDSETSTLPQFQWSVPEGGSSYYLQVALDSVFDTMVIDSPGLVANRFSSSLLEPNTTYYWRVRSANPCGEGPWSDTAAFSTADISCKNWAAAGLPASIDEQGEPEVVSIIEVAEKGTIVDLTIDDLLIEHSFVGDLKVTLTSPSGKTVTLFDRIGFPSKPFGCNSDNLALSFSDDALFPASDLENACGEDTAATGGYQPVDPFTLLQGEPAEGQWKLTVLDQNNQDGGYLQSWNLALCIAEEKDLSLKTSTQVFETCLNVPLQFNLEIGTGFNKNGLHLSVAGTPEGTEVSFSQNPAAPGSTVTVTIHEISAAGLYPLTIEGVSESDSASLPILLEVLPALKPPEQLAPMDGAVHVPLATLMQWGSVLHARAYHLEVASTADFEVMEWDTILTDTTFLLTGLKNQQRYFWKLTALNNCEESVVSPIYSFITIADVSLITSVTSLEACTQEELFFKMNIGNGFENGRLTYSIEPEAPFRLEFDIDTTHVPAGAFLTVSVTELANTPAGEYEIQLVVEDQYNRSTTSVSLSLDSSPVSPQLLFPEEEAIISIPDPQLGWEAAEDASGYRLELSRDQNFAMLLLDQELNDTTYRLAGSLDPGLYYWRIFAGNQCGETASLPGRFLLQTTGIQAMENVRVEVFPNPARNLLYIEVAGQPVSSLRADLFNTGGQLVRRQVLPGPGQHTMNLQGLPDGPYLLRLISGQTASTIRVLHYEN